MKKIILAMIMLAGPFALAACDNEEEGGGDVTEVPEEITERPTDWVVQQNLNPTTAQPVIVTSEGLPAEISKDDLLAAFIDGKCHAVSAPVTDDFGTYFTLVVMTADDAEGAQQVELRYYSAADHRIYYSDPFTQSPGERLGSLTEGGYAPHWR